VSDCEELVGGFTGYDQRSGGGGVSHLCWYYWHFL